MLVFLFEIELTPNAAEAFLEVSGFSVFVSLLVKDSRFLRTKFLGGMNFDPATGVMLEMYVGRKNLLGFFVDPERGCVGVEVRPRLNGSQPNRT